MANFMLITKFDSEIVMMKKQSLMLNAESITRDRTQDYATVLIGATIPACNGRDAVYQEDQVRR